VVDLDPNVDDPRVGEPLGSPHDPTVVSKWRVPLSAANGGVRLRGSIMNYM
jgi:hypothetical protein